MAGFGGSVKLTGESDYKKALKDITSSLKLVSSELKLTNTQFESGDKTLKQTKSSYDSMTKSVQEQRKQVNELRAKLVEAEKEYGSNNAQVKNFKTQLNKAETELKQLENATEKSTDELRDMKKGFKDTGEQALKFGDILKANVIGDFIVDGLKKVGNAVLNIGKQAISGFADYEQLIGGVETLFKESAGTVENYANNAYKTAGLSANEYMETVTSFSASLLQSLNGYTAKSAKVADMAITDMADNANKMGTSMESIQNAYQGFAKQNYTMLDNLKLGYGGTKEEMERLLKDAEKLSGHKYDISNLNDVYEAIHMVQTELGITGTTAKEASSTISGSISSMKSAWQNWLSGLADEDADLSALTSNLVESAKTVVTNLIPVIQTTLASIGEVVVQTMQEVLPEGVFDAITGGFKWIIENKDIIIAGIIGIGTAMAVLNVANMIMGVVKAIQAWKVANEGLTVAQWLMNTAMMANPIGLLVSAIAGLVAGIVVLWNTNDGFRDAVINAWEKIKEVFSAVWGAISTFFTEQLPEIIKSVIQWFANLPFEIGYALGYALGTIIKWGNDAWNYLVENVPKWIEGIAKFFSELPSKVWTWLLNTINKVAEFGSNLWQKGKEAGTNLVKAIVDAVITLPSKMLEIGINVVEGIWNGIKNAKDWIVGKIKSFASGILDGIKSALGIHSPSKVFEEEVGKNMALGLGEGFSNSMKGINKQMADAIQTDYDLSVNSNLARNSTGSSSQYLDMVNAFKQALKEVKVVMDDREMGTFVTDTMERVVYA